MNFIFKKIIEKMFLKLTSNGMASKKRARNQLRPKEIMKIC
jgi:hypothetical protein